MLILLVKVVYWVYGPWAGYKRVECVQNLVGSGDVSFHCLFSGCC